ncbi:hypothetical protein WN943_023609 [Citrus x changshan-huyou]
MRQRRDPSFPRKYIYVSHCPNLKEFPLNSQSGNKSTVLIRGEEWWNQLLWISDATKDVFSSKFIPFSDFLSWHSSQVTQMSFSNEKQVDEKPASGSMQTEAQQKKIEELKLKDKNYLFQAIDQTIFDTILIKNTSKQIWDSMKKKFEGNVRVKRSHLQALRREFETPGMKTGE